MRDAEALGIVSSAGNERFVSLAEEGEDWTRLIYSNIPRVHNLQRLRNHHGQHELCDPCPNMEV
jgi:hypothetical protein